MLPNTEELYEWYLLNGKPNREQLRLGNLKLPEGANQRLIESLLPLRSLPYLL